MDPRDPDQFRRRYLRDTEQIRRRYLREHGLWGRRERLRAWWPLRRIRALTYDWRVGSIARSEVAEPAAPPGPPPSTKPFRRRGRGGSAGVREPRRPRPTAPSAGAAPLPTDDDA